MKEQFQHTPGPWKLHTDRINAVYEIRSEPELKGICFVGHSHSNWKTNEIEANACLIAAAPELLEALMFCRSVLKNNGLFDRSEILAFQKATEAIDQATDPKPSQTIGELIPEILTEIKHTPEDRPAGQTPEDRLGNFIEGKGQDIDPVAWYAANPNE